MASGLENSIKLLKKLISTPSFSNEEAETATIWENWLKENHCQDVERNYNNVFVKSTYFDPSKPILLLNSHHDTIKPSLSYTRDPFCPDVIDDKIYGLGSNDAGAACVALANTFLIFKDEKDLPFNIIFSITASEEKMGEQGMRAFLPYLKEKKITPDMVIVGEPTGMQPAIAERGLVVIDAETKGKAGHAAREEGVNAIYKAIEDIESLKKFRSFKESDTLGNVKVSVTMINAGTQHNVIPDKCSYVIDVRTTDTHSNEEIVELLKNTVKWSELIPRSTRIRASVISRQHPLVEACLKLGLTPFVSPTTSDMALIHDIPSLKIGPGKSERSHTANEYIRISELKQSLEIYPEILRNLKKILKTKNSYIKKR